MPVTPSSKRVVPLKRGDGKEDSEVVDNTKGHKYKKTNVYDAVAGKLSSNGFISNQRAYASTRDTTSSSSRPVPPENVLFKRHDAPVRYAESDFYFANEKKSVTNLPESDMLKVLHGYISDYYSKAVDDGSGDYFSFDETALLAFGILLEEAMNGALGRNGDLVFTEGEEIASDASSTLEWDLSERQAKKQRTGL